MSAPSDSTHLTQQDQATPPVIAAPSAPAKKANPSRRPPAQLGPVVLPGGYRIGRPGQPLRVFEQVMLNQYSMFLDMVTCKKDGKDKTVHQEWAEANPVEEAQAVARARDPSRVSANGIPQIPGRPTAEQNAFAARALERARQRLAQRQQ